MVEKIYLDSENMAMGRIAGYAAKQALQGKEVALINCEKAVISGNKKDVITNLKLRRALNKQKPEKGPFYSRDSEKIMKRCVRGMLPNWCSGRGKEALKRIKCYKGIPAEMKSEKIVKVKLNQPSKSMSIGELSAKC